MIVARFCEDCPLKGNCTEEVVEYAQTFASRSKLSGGSIIAVVGALRDTAGNLSNLLETPHDVSEQTLIAAIDECEDPLYEPKGVIIKRQIPSCRAVGMYALNDKKLAASVKGKQFYRRPQL